MKQCPKCKTTHEKKGTFCSRKCSNSRIWSEEARLKKSISAKASEKVMKANKVFREPHRRGGQKRTALTETVCLHCSKPIIHKVTAVRKYHKECVAFVSGGFHENSTRKHRSFYKGYQMDSGSERQFAMLLDKYEIRWIKNNYRFFSYLDGEGKSRKYYPDFYLKDLNIWVEIKGEYYATLDKNFHFKMNSIPNLKLVYTKELRDENSLLKGLLVQ